MRKFSLLAALLLIVSVLAGCTDAGPNNDTVPSDLTYTGTFLDLVAEEERNTPPVDGELKITMRPDANLKGENLPVILGKHKNKLTFSARGTPVFFYRYKKCGVVEKDAENLIRLTEGLLADMKEILAGN